MSEISKLDAETMEELNARFLLFYIKNKLYGAPLALVLEIIQMQSITHLPSVPSYIKGIINLRGKIIPVIDVRLKLNLEEREYDDKTCIIILDMNDSNVGFIVDEVSEVITIESEQLASPPKVKDCTTKYLASVAELDGRIVLNIDFNEFLKHDIMP